MGFVSRNADYDIDPRHLRPRRCLGQSVEMDFISRNILQRRGVLEIEVMVIFDVGVEIGPAGLHNDLAQQTRGGELVQSIVDGRQRDLDMGADRLDVEPLRRQVPGTFFQQELGQSQALTGRSKA